MSTADFVAQKNPASRAVILANGGAYEDVRNGTAG